MNTDEVRVFFYGLFMDQSLLASKGIKPSSATIGSIEGDCLRIGRRATLVPDRTGRAYGVLMALRPQDVTALYSQQSVADYVAEPVSVVLSDGTIEGAVCYNLPKRKLERRDFEYARSLLLLAGELGLPEDYLQQIRMQIG